MLNALAKGAIGDAFAQIGQPQEAYEYYQRALKPTKINLALQNTFKAAMIGVELGKTTQALEYFKRIKEEFPTLKKPSL